MAAYDSLARRVLELCKQIGRSVPESVAVLGVDDDPLLCQLTTPALTSVIPNAERAGYVAAEQLDRMMDGKHVETTGTLLPPLGIAIRNSTDIVAVEDPDVAAAARFILSHAAEGIRVADVVAEVPLTRRALELRFKSMLGKTPHELIVSTRIAKAEMLLRDTSLSLQNIAYQCGIEHPEYLCVLFKKHRGTTPGEFRLAQRSL